MRLDVLINFVLIKKEERIKISPAFWVRQILFVSKSLWLGSSPAKTHQSIKYWFRHFSVIYISINLKKIINISKSVQFQILYYVEIFWTLCGLAGNEQFRLTLKMKSHLGRFCTDYWTSLINKKNYQLLTLI